MSARMRLATTSSAVTLAALMMLGTTATLSASPIETPIAYSTSGSVDSFGVVGDPILVFQGVQYGTLTTGSSFSLGRFAVAAASPGGSATYSNIPFQIALRAQSIDGAAPSVNDTPVIIHGKLTAVVANGAIENLVAMYTTTSDLPLGQTPFPTLIPPFRIGDFTGYLQMDNFGVNGAPVGATLNVTPVPEPATMLVFAAAAGLIALRAKRSKA